MKDGSITNKETRERKTLDLEILNKAKTADKKAQKRPLRINPYTTILVKGEKRTKKYARKYAEKIGITYQE